MAPLFFPAHLADLLIQKTTQKQSFKRIWKPNIENPVTVITLGAGGRGNVYGNYGIQFPKELDIIGVAEPISIRNERYTKNIIFLKKIDLTLGNMFLIDLNLLMPLLSPHQIIYTMVLV